MKGRFAYGDSKLQGCGKTPPAILARLRGFLRRSTIQPIGCQPASGLSRWPVLALRSDNVAARDSRGRIKVVSWLTILPTTPTNLRPNPGEAQTPVQWFAYLPLSLIGLAAISMLAIAANGFTLVIDNMRFLEAYGTQRGCRRFFPSISVSQ